MILTVFIRDSSERDLHYGAPAYRTVDIHLTGQQVAQMDLKQTHRIGTLVCYEEIDRCILQNYVTHVEDTE